jgi:formylglycine-generating enzyme required for sulfatase activity
MVVVPAGHYLMGSSASEPRRNHDEGPQHVVSIPRPFAVGKFAVTFAEWDACVTFGNCPPVSDSGFGRGTQPVINVSWDDARKYVAWLSKSTGKPYRLLTEAEREYAARAGTTSVYPWGDEIGKGDDPGTERAKCDGCGSPVDEKKQTAPVGSFPANAFGLHDMAGNVWEWVEDCYQPNYIGAPTDGSAHLAGDCSRRVVRGGSWQSRPDQLRSGNRGLASSVTRTLALGVRVARTLSAE